MGHRRLRVLSDQTDLIVPTLCVGTITGKKRFIRQLKHPDATLAKMPAFSTDTAGHRREQRTRSHFRQALGPGT
jgi:uncharacterized membrane protein